MFKTLVFHDTFLMKWGAERMNIEIAKILDADIATATWSKDCYNAREMWFMGDIFEVNTQFRRWMIGFLRMKWQFFRSSLQNKKKGFSLKNYERILFSNEAISGIWWVGKGVKTYYYAHSISRHLFDQYELYLSKVPVLLKPFYIVFAYFLQRIYIAELWKVWTIFVNSKKNQVRMREWIDRDDAIILSPPVDTEKFRIIDKNTILQTFAIEWISASYKGYYISFSRLTHAKRIDTIIRAFAKIPDKKLLILYGNNDSQKDEFMKLGKYPNIIFHSLEDNENLPHIINGAIASISISREEDFGMVAIESMACGVPIIAVDEWGYQESIIEWKTGFLLSTDSLEKNLKEKIEQTSTEVFHSMQQACIERANDFSLEKFREKLLYYFQ